jgi:hypothetical protein
MDLALALLVQPPPEFLRGGAFRRGGGHLTWLPA